MASIPTGKKCLLEHCRNGSFRVWSRGTMLLKMLCGKRNAIVSMLIVGNISYDC